MNNTDFLKDTCKSLAIGCLIAIVYSFFTNSQIGVQTWGLSLIGLAILSK